MDRPLYILPFRIVVLALVGVFLIGALGGALSAWITLRRTLRITEGGERVIERVEQVAVSGEDALASAAEAVASSVFAILDGQGRITQQAVAVTADGVFASTGTVPRGPVRVRLSGGEVVPASVVRIYRDVGLFFLKVSGSFSAPALEREEVGRPGASLVAVASAPEGSGPRVRIATIEAVTVSGTFLHLSSPGLERLPKLAFELPASFEGAPIAGADGRIRGLAILGGDGSFLIPSGVVGVLLQDYLRHPEGTEVELLKGLRGHWQLEDPTKEGAPVFRVVTVEGGSIFLSAGLRAADELRGLGGKPFEGPLPLLEPLLQAARATERISIDVRRAPAATLTVELTPTVR